MKTILAIDYGDKKCGLAKSDELGFIATPLNVIKTQPKKIFYENIKSTIEKYSIKAILVGIPYGLKTKETIQTKKVKDFIKEIKTIINLNVFEIDESFSSKIALDRLHQNGKKFKQVKKNFDAYAAAVFLQDFIDNLSTSQKELLKND